jgi:hypothetical protein
VAFAVAAAALRRRVRGQAGLLGLFVLFPCTFLGVNLGAGWPTIIAIHLATPFRAVTLAGTLMSVLLALIVIGVAAKLTPDADPVVDTGSDSRQALLPVR